MEAKGISFRHQGLKFVGVLGRPDKPSRGAPAVLMLHGYPGAEKSADIARALLLRGIGFLQLHFRGAWGSEGEYAFRNLVEDARAGLSYLAGREGLDAGRLGVFGYSMGGWTALRLAASDARVRAVAAVSPVGRQEGRHEAETREFVKRSCAALRVGDPEALADDYFASVAPADPVDAAAQLGKRPLLLIHGESDELIPADVSRSIYKAASGPKTLSIVRGAMHSFLPQRERLTRRVADWFAKTL